MVEHYKDSQACRKSYIPKIEDSACMVQMSDEVKY